MAKSKFPKKVNGDAAVTPAPAPSTVTSSAPAIATETTAVPELKKTLKKPTIIRSEGRANLVPINVEDEIRQLAYLLSERRGFEPGHETEDWLTAEHEVRQRYHQQSA